MGMRISLKKYWEENISLIIIGLGFIELLSEEIHDILKWPMIALGILSLLLCFAFHKISKRNIFVILVVIVLTIFEIVFSEGILATQYIWDIGICMPIALCIYYAKRVKLKKWIVLYILVTLYLFLRMTVSPDYYAIFYNHSRNYISVFEIFFLFMASIIAYKNKKELPNWMYYVTALICVAAVGRGGIIAALIILALHIIYDAINEKKLENKTVKIIILIIGFIVLFLIFAFFQDYIIQKFFPRFAHSGTYSDSSDIAVNKRLLMWKTYINQCLYSLKLFILGADPNPIVLKVHYRYDFNLHNSFLMFHAFYGIFGLITLLICSIKFYRRFLCEKKIEIVIIFIGYMIRALTDHCFPGKLSGIVIWIIIFYGLNYRKNKT